MTKAEYRQQIRALLSATDFMMEDRTKRVIEEGINAFAEHLKQDLEPELRKAGFSAGEIEELFRPERRSMH